MSDESMETALTNLEPPKTPARGDGLLLHHVLCVSGAEPRPPARERLEQAVGRELAGLLVTALTPSVQGLRGSSSP
jgi:hypothetical protein